jgi:hypothetical protein
VGFLEKAEERIESSVSSLFAKFSKAELQPVEITQAVRTAMDQAASTLDADRLLVPNSYMIVVSEFDAQKISSAMLNVIKSDVARHANTKGYRLAGELDLKLSIDPKVHRGGIKVGFTAIEKSVSWEPALIFDGQRKILKIGTTSVGRDNSSEIVVDDRGLSRVHFEIAWNGEIAAIRDINSTNGTFVDGSRITEVVLRPGSKVSAGRTDFEFELSARAIA